MDIDGHRHSLPPRERPGTMMLFRPANAKAVRDAAFIDGRTDIWAGDGVSIPFDRLVLASGTEISRYILHMA